MLSRVLALLGKDWVYTRRENLLVYMIGLSIVIAVLLRLFLPAAEQAGLTFAVDSSVPAEAVAGLRELGEVEVYDGRDALVERVLRFDDVAGIYFESGQYVVVLEGNEAEYIQELSSLSLDYVVQGKDLVNIGYRSSGVAATPIRGLAGALLVFFCILVGSITLGLNLVNERETKTIAALAVSPLSTVEYIIGKSILVLVVSLSLSLLCTLIFLGPAGVNYLHLQRPCCPRSGSR